MSAAHSWSQSEIDFLERGSVTQDLTESQIERQYMQQCGLDPTPSLPFVEAYEPEPELRPTPSRQLAPVPPQATPELRVGPLAGGATPTGSEDLDSRVEPTAHTPSQWIGALAALSQVSASPPPPRRVRLRVKTTADSGVYQRSTAHEVQVLPPPPSVASYVAVQDVWYEAQRRTLQVKQTFWLEGEYKKLNAKQQRGLLYDRVRNFWALHLARDSSVKDRLGCRDSGVAASRGLFATLPKKEQRDAADTWVVCTKPPTWLAQHLDLYFSGTDVCGAKSERHKAVLLTWVGPWTLERPACLVGEGETRRNLKLLVQELRTDEQVVSLWSRVKAHAEVVRRSVSAPDYAVCLEVCPESYMNEGRLQLHFHLFLKSQTWMSFRRLPWMYLDGAGPNVARTIGGLSQTRQSGNWSGYFYCCVEKEGHLFHLANKRAFKDYLVNTNWVMHLLQSKKLDLDEAKSLVSKCVSGAHRTLQDLNLLETRLEQEALAKEKSTIQEQLAKSLLTWRTYPQVHEWQQQFFQILHRYQFLVLNGPSRLGKTVFARSLCREGKEVLEINCSSGSEPDLRAYRIRKHDLLLFDEIEAPQVAAQRKLFQAPATEVQLGCSATNCHSYSVWIHCRKLVLATNNWQSSMAKLGKGDREWIEKNSILLEVDAPMWVID